MQLLGHDQQKIGEGPSESYLHDVLKVHGVGKSQTQLGD